MLSIVIGLRQTISASCLKEGHLSESITIIMGKNIRKLREEHQMSQQGLAEKMNLSRPGISNWENGKSEPSSSQLVQLSKIFSVSTDELVGNIRKMKQCVVVDTSALIKRPYIVEELHLNFDEVIIPEVVISELNNLKDSSKSSLKQRAWLVMNAINEKKDLVNYAQNIKHDGKNDEKIAAIARKRAQQSPFDDIYILTDDIWFQFLTAYQKNLHTLTPTQYYQKINHDESVYDPIKSIEFFSCVKQKKINQVMQFNLSQVNINMVDPDSGLPPLIAAVRNRDIPMLKFLISLRGINLDIQDKHKYRFTAVHHATQLKSIEMIKLLVEAGADIDRGSAGKNHGNTPLMVAAWSGFIEGVDFFLSHDACTNQQDNNGFTPLIKACIKHHVSIVKKLVKISDLNVRSRENKKAIDYIKVSNKNSKVIMELFKDVIHDR